MCNQAFLLATSHPITEGLLVKVPEITDYPSGRVLMALNYVEDHLIADLVMAPCIQENPGHVRVFVSGTVCFNPYLLARWIAEALENVIEE